MINVNSIFIIGYRKYWEYMHFSPDMTWNFLFLSGFHHYWFPSSNFTFWCWTMKNILLYFYILGFLKLFHYAKGIQKGIPFSSKEFESLTMGPCLTILATPTSSFPGKLFWYNNLWRWVYKDSKNESIVGGARTNILHLFEPCIYLWPHDYSMYIISIIVQILEDPC